MPPRAQDRVMTRGATQRRRRNGASVEPANWAMADPLVLQALISAVTAQGGAVRFGYSRDGGAYSVGILGDGDPYTEWIRPTENLDMVLADIARGWTGEASTGEAPETG
jgi:hypothetical protein